MMRHSSIRQRSHTSGSDEEARIARVLSGTDLFRGLETSELTSFVQAADLRNYRAGSLIYTPEHASAERLFILKEGRVERYRLTPAGKRLVTRRILPGEVFGVMGLLGRTMQGNFAEATRDSMVYVLTRDRVLSLLRRRPDFAVRVLENLGNRVRRLEERLVDVAYSPATVRIARFLLDNVDSTSGLLANVTHEQIADTIGTVRQTVSETLSLMKKRGVIDTGRRKILILDRPRLQEIVTM